MGLRLELVLCCAGGLAIAFIACEDPIARPKTTPTSAITPAGGVVTQSSGNGTTTGATTTSSSSSGSGGAGPSPEVVHVLTCADHETHVTDCEACRASETQGVCTAEWQSCLDDPYC